MVKVPWTGSAESFEIVTSSVPIPVLISGGPKKLTNSDLQTIVEKSVYSGGSGVCMGRYIFDSHDPASLIRSLRAIVHDGANSDEASRYLR